MSAVFSSAAVLTTQDRRKFLRRMKYKTRRSLSLAFVVETHNYPLMHVGKYEVCC
jgi:hypothetical protein